MKGFYDGTTSTAGWRPQFVCAGSQDYLVTTMKLRDRVQTAKCNSQGTKFRRTIRSLRSAPPFQNRNLDNYPMPHNWDDAVRSSRSHRTKKGDSTRRMVREQIDSGLMREYSKQMFEFTVKNEKNLKRSVENGKYSRRPKSVAEGMVRQTNGPSLDGSMLHNCRQQVLNSIRVRPHPDYVTRFNHDRSSSRQSLRSTIDDKNRHYRVRSVAESTRPGSILGNDSFTGSDFVFIPVDQSSGDGYIRHDTTGSEASECTEDSLDAVFGKDLFDDAVQDSSSPCRQGQNVRQSRHSSYLLPPDISCNIRLVSLEDESSSDSETEKEEPPPEVKKPEPTPPVKTTGRGKKQVKIIVEEEKKVPETEPEPEPVKVKLILKGPHCWVDDATVTSETFEDEEADDNPDGANIDVQENTQAQRDGNKGKPPNGQKVDSTNKVKDMMKTALTAYNKSVGGTSIRQANILDMKNAFEKAVQEVQSKPTDPNETGTNQQGLTNVETDESPEQVKQADEIVLPQFICPSSEKKSREAALKDWLAHTCFRTGYRDLPVV